jgi:hypothetical protein
MMTRSTIDRVQFAIIALTDYTLKAIINHERQLNRVLILRKTLKEKHQKVRTEGVQEIGV